MKGRGDVQKVAAGLGAALGSAWKSSRLRSEFLGERVGRARLLPETFGATMCLRLCARFPCAITNPPRVS